MLEKNRIYNMDVLEGLRTLTDNSVDLIVTSPLVEGKTKYTRLLIKRV